MTATTAGEDATGEGEIVAVIGALLGARGET